MGSDNLFFKIVICGWAIGVIVIGFVAFHFIAKFW